MIDFTFLASSKDEIEAVKRLQVIISDLRYAILDANIMNCNGHIKILNAFYDFQNEVDKKIKLNQLQVLR